MIFHAVKFLLTFLLVIAIFNLMIIVHELGHFLAAKWRGFVIEEFGVWFGKAIWKKKFGGVWFSVGSLPFGGFVKLPQMAAMDAVEGHSEIPADKLPPVTPLSKIIVAFAGPLFSFLLAVAFAVIVWIAGRPVSEAEATTVIGAVEPDSPAAEVKLQPGDKILSIDGYKVTRWGGMGKDSITWRIVSSEGETLDMQVQRGNEVIEVHPKPNIPDTKFWQRKAHRQLLIEPAETPLVGKVNRGAPAEQAGVRAGDRILKMNGRPIYSFNDLAAVAAEHPGEPARFTIGRLAPDRKTLETFETSPVKTEAAIVADVIKGGPAEKAGLKAGDRVTFLNGQPVRFRGQIHGAN